MEGEKVLLAILTHSYKSKKLIIPLKEKNYKNEKFNITQLHNANDISKEELDRENTASIHDLLASNNDELRGQKQIQKVGIWFSTYTVTKNRHLSSTATGRHSHCAICPASCPALINN